MNFEYNTQRPGIILKGYGRNVQKLVEFIRQEPDKEKRTRMAHTLIELIKQLAPVAKEGAENPQRMWDDLYIIADFNLDVNNPFPIPDRETVFKKPQRMPYPQTEVRYRHYGKNMEYLVQEALKKEGSEREDAAIYLGKLMKTFYASWNKETLDDTVIIKDLKNLSKGELTLDLDKVREENLFEKLYHERTATRNGGNRPQQGKNGGRSGRPYNKNKNRR
jgi:hypothetical protein